MNWSLGALIAEVPLGVVTVTSTVPVPDGATTVRVVAELITLIEVPAFGAEVDGGGTGEAGAADRDGVVPPAGGPLVGLTPVTVGAGRCRCTGHSAR